MSPAPAPAPSSPSPPKILILDGGMSRELIRLQAPFRQPEWSALALLESPHLVKQVHSEFISSGADIVTTNSYALVPFHIGEERFWSRGEELVSLAGKLAREAVDERREPENGREVLVAGSLPPIFGSYEPQLFDEGNVDRYLDVLVRSLEPYVDFWLGETLSLIAEAEAVKRVVKAYERKTGRERKKVWISFTLQDDPDDQDSSTPKLRSGESVTEAAKWAIASNVECLLFNCSRPEVMAEAVKEARQVLEQGSLRNTSIRIGVYANAFESKTTGEGGANEVISSTREDLSVEPYLDFAREWVRQGASVVGGCCGIGCEHIARLAQEFRSG